MGSFERLVRRVFVIGVLASCPASAQQITHLVVDVRTQDKAFAGTDDDVHLQIGGRNFPLDDPKRDDFERGQVDRFEFDLSNQPLTVDLIRGIGQISVIKLQDSFWGGGWDFGGLTIWAETAASEPLYSNSSINTSLDGDDLEWTTTLGEVGWNVPEPEAFPACSTPGPVILLRPTSTHTAVPRDSSNADADCDGIPDESDPTFDPPTDSDGDGLPDLYETQTGGDPNDPDTDDDGWMDGRNRRSYLVLTRIRCDDEQEDIGRDELYLTAEDIRYPASYDLNGYWAMDDGSQRFPGVVLDVRTLPLGVTAGFRTRLRLRESDMAILERPTDDDFEAFEIEWNEDGTTTHTYQSDDAKYVLTLRWFTVNFRDPRPTQDADGDQDGHNESVEARLSIQDPTVQPQNSNGQLIRVPGYDGLADPEQRELWVEIDAVGSDQAFMFDAKQMVASQFAYHQITPRFDDGYLGGGQILDYVETLTPTDRDTYRMDATKFSPNRLSLRFRYALVVDKLERGAGFFGDAAGTRVIFRGVPGLGQTLLAQAQPIFFMHEVGHTLGLCHRAGDVSPTCSTCPTPMGWVGCTNYCGVDQSSTTAMGSETSLDRLTDLLGPALAGVGAGVVVGGLIGGLPGAIIGGIVGGVVGGLFGATNADFYERAVNYHDNEWNAVQL